MKIKVFNFLWNVVDYIELNINILFSNIRFDLIKEIIRWQQSKRRQGTHVVKSVGQVSGSNKKPFKQKGSGRARQGCARAINLRGGGVSHGPVLRSHVFKLNKKVRVLALKSAILLSIKNDCFYVFQNLNFTECKSIFFLKVFHKLILKKILLVDVVLDKNLCCAVKSLNNVHILPVVGVNVYDIMNNDYVIFSKNAIIALQQRWYLYENK